MSIKLPDYRYDSSDDFYNIEKFNDNFKKSRESFESVEGELNNRYTKDESDNGFDEFSQKIIDQMNQKIDKSEIEPLNTIARTDSPNNTNWHSGNMNPDSFINLNGGKRLPENSDLNELTEYGTYYIPDYIHMETIKNLPSYEPTTDAHLVYGSRIGGKYNWEYQEIVYRYNNAYVKWYRASKDINNTKIWESWIKISDSRFEQNINTYVGFAELSPVLGNNPSVAEIFKEAVKRSPCVVLFTVGPNSHDSIKAPYGSYGTVELTCLYEEGITLTLTPQFKPHGQQYFGYGKYFINSNSLEWSGWIGLVTAQEGKAYDSQKLSGYELQGVTGTGADLLNRIMFLRGDGGIEVGNCMDFHESFTAEEDFSVRLFSAYGRLYVHPAGNIYDTGLKNIRIEGTAPVEGGDSQVWLQF